MSWYQRLIGWPERRPKTEPVWPSPADWFRPVDRRLPTAICCGCEAEVNDGPCPYCRCTRRLVP